GEMVRDGEVIHAPKGGYWPARRPLPVGGGDGGGGGRGPQRAGPGWVLYSQARPTLRSFSVRYCDRSSSSSVSGMLPKGEARSFSLPVPLPGATLCVSGAEV